MSQLHADLIGQAAQLGFHSIEEAEINGYEVDYEKGILVEEREKAHDAWLKEKEQVLNELRVLRAVFANDEYKREIDSQSAMDIIYRTIQFIEKGEV